MRILAPLLLSLILCGAIPAHAANSEQSRASEDLSAASAIVLVGSMSMLAGSAQIVVVSVEAVADGLVVVLKGASDAATATVKLSAQAARGLSLAAGTSVQVLAVSTGHVLVLSGKAIAYIPNAIGNSLLHHSAS